MFDVGLQELIVIAVIALLVFGPSKLPELGRRAGRALRELRRASDEFRSTVETNLHLNLNDSDTDPAGPVAEAISSPVSDNATARLPSETAPTLVAESISATTTSDTAQPPELFCAQSGSRLFHYRKCSWAARIGEDARVDLQSVADARARGYLPCPVCEPWEAA